MKMVNTHEAKTHLSRLLDEAFAGEEIVIAKAGKPVARLVRYENTGNPRTLGLLKGQITESPDCWEADEDMLSSTDAPLYTQAAPLPNLKIAEEPGS
jgi:prevent-host-death family protein